MFAPVVQRLIAAGCIAAVEEATELLDSAPDESTLESCVCRREAGEPLAWITGTVLFCGQRLHVAPGVYVPRPQSEALARRAASLLPVNGRAVDFCTGAGAIAAYLTARVPTATVIGVDVDAQAAECARRNQVRSVLGDLDAALHGREDFDLVTAVPPYVPTDEFRFLAADVQRYEPHRALDGGPDGLDVARRVIDAARRLLRPGGWLLLEVGGDQDETLAPILATCAFEGVTAWHDDDGDLRGIATCRGASLEP